MPKVKKEKANQCKDDDDDQQDDLVYSIPKTIYDKAMAELNYEPKYDLMRLKQRCHQTTYDHFDLSKEPNNNANQLVAAKQALENRDFPVLYNILTKALNVKENFLTQQIYEYLYLAICNDPAIDDKKAFLADFFFRVQQVEGDWENHMKNIEHTIKSTKRDD